ncbi:MAG: SGNH/GDSL hydrolase family protein [Chloroflexi bacterium]|nr:SGNH/GDSL hydrolase family protein [Chloroflexota bacterium]MCC6897273.1 SGNH/GDSL hydrolase family protein [Anaerolineae bacterium]
MFGGDRIAFSPYWSAKLRTIPPRRYTVIFLIIIALLMGSVLRLSLAQGENPLPALSDKVVSKIKTIAMIGKVRENNLYVFAKVGDSITVGERYLYPFGTGLYQLRDHTYLQAVVDAYVKTPVREVTSFDNPSVASAVGWAAYNVLAPRSADPYQCEAGESPLVCEYRIIQPSVAFIMFGTNDVGYRTEDEFSRDMGEIVKTSMEMGVIPVLMTIPPQPRVPDRVVAFNGIIRDLAYNNDLPLIDVNAAFAPLPNSGLAYDNVHPSWPPGDEELAADFTVENLTYGCTVRNLLTLQMLDLIWKAIQPDPKPTL